MVQSLEDELKSLKSKVAKAKTTLPILHINEAHLKDSVKIPALGKLETAFTRG
jgi:hypothetical protein